MATKQQAPRPPQDPYAQRGKTLTSAVKRLRGWAGSDPSRSAELADALVALTEHRLLGHAYAAAAEDAQDAIRRSAEVLGANGPIGPYTAVEDAVRYLTAVTQVAAIQVGMGLPESAGRTLASLDDLHRQLHDLGLEAQPTPLTAIWSSWVSARAALVSGDAPAANTHADAARAGLTGAGLAEAPDTELVQLDVDRLLSDTRWAAGRAAEALGAQHTAKDRYDTFVDGRLQDPGRLSPALVERLAEPLFGLYRDLADRLAALGDLELSLVTRRELVDRLRLLVPRLGDRARLQLGLSLADLASDLMAAERLGEAETAAAEAAELILDWSAAGPARMVVGAVRGRVMTRTGNPAEAAALLRRILPHPVGAPTAAYAVALQALVEALRADGEIEAAESTARRVTEAVAGLVPAGADPAAVLDLARGVVSRGRASVGPPDETAAWLAAERAEAHRLERQRQEAARVEAEQREAARREAARLAAEQEAAEQVRAEEARRLAAARQAAAEEADRLETKRRREERLEEHRLEMERRAAEEAGTEVEPAAVDAPEVTDVEVPTQEVAHVPVTAQEVVEVEPTPQPVAAAPELEPETEPLPAPEPPPVVRLPPVVEPPPAPDELAVAQQEWQAARDRGDRRGARAANERVVELLRPRAETDLAGYGPQLLAALEDLSSARLRSGDIWGSRAPAKEAKALAKSLGR